MPVPTTGDDDAVRLTTDPARFSPGYTREVASAAAEAIRVLNHATQERKGIGTPADAESLAWHAHSMTSRLPQFLRQLAEWELRALEEERIRPDGRTAVGDLAASLMRASELAETLGGELKTAFELSATVNRHAVRTWDDDEDEDDG